MASPDILDRLSRFWIFESFDEDDLAQIAQIVQPDSFRTHEIVFRQGDEPDYFYLIESGAIQEIGEDQTGKVVLRRRAEERDFVGRYSLMNGTRRRATAIAVDDTQVLSVNAADFQAMLAAFPQLSEGLRRTRVVNRLLATPLFAAFSREQLYHLADLARVREYPAGEIIYRQGDASNAFCVVDTGQVKLDVSGSKPGGQIWPKYLTAGSFFGRRDLLKKAPRRATARATTELRLFRFNEEAFRWLGKLQPAFSRALDRPDVLAMLQSTPLFSHLDQDELQKLAGYVGLAHFPAGQIIYHHGEQDPTLYFMFDGEAVLRVQSERGGERPIGYLRPGQWVGEPALLLEEPREATLEAVVDSDWLYLTRQDLERFLAQNPDAYGNLALEGEIEQKRRWQRFPWMDPDEQFVLRMRRHSFYLVNRLILPMLLALLAVPLLMLELPGVLPILLVAGAGAWTLWRLADWRNDYYIVTTKRVAHREKVLGIRETRDETPLDKIQNMNIEYGFWGNLFDFGALVIDTAAAAGVTRVTFDYVGQPESVQATIFEQVNRLRAGEGSEASKQIRDRLEENMGLSIRPMVPYPAVPTEENIPDLMEPQRLWDLLGEATWRRSLWIERREGDRITWRKHWIRLVVKVWLPSLVLAILLGLLVLLTSTGPTSSGILAFFAVLFVPAVVWWWWNFVNWGNDLYTVTDDRIIDTEALPMGFRSKRTETTFDRIQNVSYVIPHPLATLLNYGTVVIYTAGAEGTLDFLYVRDPRSVQAEIFRRFTAYEAGQRRRERDQRWQELPQWFATYQGMHRP